MRILIICLLTLCLYRGQILHSHLLNESRAARHNQEQNMPFPFLPSLFLMLILHFLAQSLFSCPSLASFNGTAGNRRSYEQCELVIFSWETATGGRVHWALVMLLTCTYGQYKSMLGNAPARVEGSENTELLGLDASRLLTSWKSFK